MSITKQLKPYVALANMISESFGNKCEVVLHDLSTPQHSVVYVANGIITDRKVGQSFDHLIKYVLLSNKFNNDYTANYSFRTDSGKQIKSSTSLIRDENDQVIGAFCINMQVDDLLSMQIFLNRLLNDKMNEKQEYIPEEKPFEHVNDIINDLINKTIGQIDVSSLQRKDNIELLTFMYEKGIFLAKGSIEKVAEKLNVSPVTIYSYLDEIKKKEKRKQK